MLRTTPSIWVLLVIFSSIVHATRAVECLSSIHDIYDAEKTVTNTKQRRTYTLCPNRRYKIGTYDYYGKKLLRGSKSEPPLPLRPNIEIQCGDDADSSALSSRSCFIDSGDLQVDGTAIHGLGGEHLGSVEIVGFVFEDALKHSFWATKPGSVTFRNCEWTNINRSDGPIKLDYFDHFGKQDILAVSFEDCKFHNNEYFGNGAQTAIVYGNSRQNQMKFLRTVFNNNNMKKNIPSTETRTHLIESLGELSIENTCFVKNKVSAANVAVYKNKLTSSEVVHINDTGGSLCQFASVFENYEQYRSLNPFCIPIDSSKIECDLDFDSVGDKIEPVNQYVPFTINALEYDSAFEKEDSILQGDCNRQDFLQINGPDAQNTKDPICLEFGGCHVSHTAAGEYLVYRFGHSKDGNPNGLVDISVRVASNNKKKFRLELIYDDEVEASKTLFAQGLGYLEFTTITWQNVPLKTTEPVHSIRLWFVQGNINFCAIGVNSSEKVFPSPTLAPTRLSIPPEPVRKVPPITWAALDYDMAYELTPDTSLGNCNGRGDGVDAQPTADDICINRDNSNCNIGWWSRDEYLIYRFNIPEGGRGSYSIRARVATRSDQSIHMGLTIKNGKVWDSTSLLVPKNGWQNFNDVIWESVLLEPDEYSLKLTSSGSTNLCSVAIFLSDTSDGPAQDDAVQDEDYSVIVPGTYSAMYYSDAELLDSTVAHLGDCPFRKDTSVDAKINNDSICKQSKTDFDQHCNIAFTEQNEFLLYDFKKESNQDSVKVSIRIASKRERQIRVELYSSDMILLEHNVVQTRDTDSWNTYYTIVVWDQISIGNEETFKMKVTFLEGQVNFCSFAIE